MQKEKFKIIYEDSDITVCEKFKGVPSENTADGEKGLVRLLSEQTGRDIHLLHRLDRNVGGVMVFANNKKSAAALSVDISNGVFYKEYLAVTDGVPEESKGVYKDLLFKDSKKNRSYVVKRMRKGVREASLEYTVLKVNGGKALADVILHTGRTHQIRVQFASRKTPLTGDVKYGSRDRTVPDIALHSHKIEFFHPVTKEKMSFVSQPDFGTYPWSIFGGDA